MTVSGSDLAAAVKLRHWVDDRSRPRKRARLVAKCFGRTKLTERARSDIEAALLAAGVEATPSIAICDREEWLHLVASGPPQTIALDDTVSAVPPSQLVAWHEFNWTGGEEPAGEDTGPAVGEWLPCLKDTRLHDRQLIWSAAAVAGIVTFAGWTAWREGSYLGWGCVERLRAPIARSVLLGDNRTASRFDSRGIKALEGSPIRLSPELAEALAEMAGGLPATEVPLDEPNYNEQPVIWLGPHGLKPEAYIEAAVASQRRLWAKLGFPHAPARQRVLGAAGRVDLIAGDVVGEAKRAVTLRDGPDQIERYLKHLEIDVGRPRSALRGILLQCSVNTSQAIIDRLEASPYTLQLWSVIDDGSWRLTRLV